MDENWEDKEQKNHKIWLLLNKINDGGYDVIQEWIVLHYVLYMSLNGLKFQLLMLSHMELEFEDQKVMPMGHMHCTRKLKPYVFAHLFPSFFYFFFCIFS